MKEAMLTAIRDIRESLSDEGKTYIIASVRDMQRLGEADLDMYSSTTW